MTEPANISDRHKNSPTDSADEIWFVWRQGDAGDQFPVKGNLTFESARQLLSELESNGHKQLYWIQRSRNFS